MIRKYIVTIDNVKYEVEVEANDVVKSAKAPAVQAAPVAAAAPAAAPAPVAAAAPAASAPAAVSADGEKVVSPLPGTLLKTVAKQGSAVKSGDVLCIVEAMKMENEIRSPKDGTVASIAVSEGASVAAGDLLYVIA